MLWWTLWRLKRQLTSDYSGMRKQAARDLGKIKDTRAVNPLIAALKDGEQIVQWEVAKALGEIGDARAVEPLMVTLKDSEYWLRKEAIRALGQIGDARAVESLVEVLIDGESNWVRQEAAVALGKLGVVRAVEPLLEALKDGDSYVRQAAAMALGQIGDSRAVEPLIDCLKDGERRVRGTIPLGEYTLWVKLLGDAPLGEMAVYALGRIGDARAVYSIITLLEYEGMDEDLTRAKLERHSWATYGGPRYRDEPHLLRLRRGVAAAEVLGVIGDTRAIEPLIRYAHRVQHALWPRHGVAVAVSSLEQLLSREYTSTPAEVLTILVNLHLVDSCLMSMPTGGLSQDRYGGYHKTYMDYIGSQAVDCSRVTLLARQELMRRGLEA